MSLTFGFCLGESGTKNDSAQFSDAFHAVFGDGITLYRNQFSITLNGFSTSLAPGYAVAAGRWLKNEDSHTLTLPTAGNTRDRWDALAARVDYAARKVSLEVLVDVDPGALRADQSAVRGEDSYSLILYFIHVRRGATTLAPDDVTDVRGEENLCGYLLPLAQAAEKVLYVYEYLVSGLDLRLEELMDRGAKAIRTGDRAIAYLDRQAEEVTGNALGDVLLSAVQPTPQRNWLLCNGAAVPEGYPALSELLDGVLPNLPQEDGRLRAWVFGAEKRTYTGGHEEDTYLVKVPVTPAGGGTVSGAGSYRQSSPVALEAVPASKHEFVAWRENGAEISTKSKYQFPVYCNRTIAAVFAAIYQISVTLDPAGAGTVSGAGTYRAGETVALKATPGNLYSFLAWREGGETVSENAAYSFPAGADRQLVAAFKEWVLEWVVTNFLPITDPASVAYGNGKFVVVGWVNSGISYSADGRSWIAVTAPQICYRSVTYGNGKFVAVANAVMNDALNSFAAYSTDGITWKESKLPAHNPYFNNWNSVAYGNGKFVAIAYSSDQNYAAYSTDGINWKMTGFMSEVGTVAFRYAVSVTYGNGKFVVVTGGVGSESNIAAYSTDGINWKTTVLPRSAEWTSVTYGGGKFVAVAFQSLVAAYSTDGINWLASTMNSDSPWRSVTYGGGKFVAVSGNAQTSAYSADGITWKNSQIPWAAEWRGVAYGNEKFVAIAPTSSNNGRFAQSR